MKLFVFMPRWRTLGKVHTALWKARAAWGRPHMYVEYQNDQPFKEGYDNVTYLYEKARQQFLATDCDAFVSVEDDIIIPEHGFGALADADKDVVMGVYCLRQKPNFRWNTFHRVGDDEGISLTEHNPNTCITLCRHESIYPVDGVGLGFTMIKRHVLEQLTFERRGSACNDWYFSIDCQERKIQQYGHFGVLCGHIMTDGVRRVLWPDPKGHNLHREELF